MVQLERIPRIKLSRTYRIISFFCMFIKYTCTLITHFARGIISHLLCPIFSHLISYIPQPTLFNLSYLIFQKLHIKLSISLSHFLHYRQLYILYLISNIYYLIFINPSPFHSSHFYSTLYILYILPHIPYHINKMYL